MNKRLNENSDDGLRNEVISSVVVYGARGHKAVIHSGTVLAIV